MDHVEVKGNGEGNHQPSTQVPKEPIQATGPAIKMIVHGFTHNLHYLP